uniref:Putative secreted protein n=1 Tax=Anopheles darlingi TaxID=43151 RepID=A0A2M4D697_ANODA
MCCTNYKMVPYMCWKEKGRVKLFFFPLLFVLSSRALQSIRYADNLSYGFNEGNYRQEQKQPRKDLQYFGVMIVP